MGKSKFVGIIWVAVTFVLFGLSGCAATYPPAPAAVTQVSDFFYIIGPGDSLDIQVWRNPEVSKTLPVRPDGKISTPLVEDLTAANKTPSIAPRGKHHVGSNYGVVAPLVCAIQSCHFIRRGRACRARRDEVRVEIVSDPIWVCACLIPNKIHSPMFRSIDVRRWVCHSKPQRNHCTKSRFQSARTITKPTAQLNGWLKP